jgi:hypothetical protein
VEKGRGDQSALPSVLSLLIGSIDGLFLATCGMGLRVDGAPRRARKR